MDLSNTTITWRGLTFYGRTTDPDAIVFTELEGWEERPPMRQDSPERPSNHGRFDSPMWADERTITLSGVCYSPTDRDGLMARLGAVMTWAADGGQPEDLVIDQAGVTLTAHARLRRYKATVGAGSGWASGRFPYAVEWVCADPLRYAPPVPASTGFPQLVGGLEFDLFTDGTTDTGVLEFGAASATGRLVMTNPGNADAWPTYEVAGLVADEGFDILTVGTGDIIRFQHGVPAGSTLLIDSATGVVTIDGYADRSTYLTIRDWAPVPPKGSLEVEFVNLGSPSAATLTATIRPGYW